MCLLQGLAAPPCLRIGGANRRPAQEINRAPRNLFHGTVAIFSLHGSAKETGPTASPRLPGCRARYARAQMAQMPLAELFCRAYPLHAARRGRGKHRERAIDRDKQDGCLDRLP